MSGSLKNFLAKFPGGSIIFSLYKNLKFRIYFPFFRGKEALFTDYYDRRIWGNSESYSGPGSTLLYTKSLRKELPELIKKFQVQTLLDAPCGDFNWFSKLQKELSINYIGGDIVKPLIENNKMKFSDGTTEFIHLDITKNNLPEADLWLCRDCWIHFSDSDIKKALTQFLQSDIPYLLATTHPGCLTNKNIVTGEVRLLNLEIAPFNFPEPILKIDDWVEGHPEKKLALWKRKDIEAQIQKVI